MAALLRGHPGQPHQAAAASARGAVAPNNSAAFRWAQRSAAQGHTKGIFLLAEFYRDGVGVPADAAEAARLFKHAARRGLAAPCRTQPGSVCV